MSDWKLLNTSTASGASSVEFTDLTGYKIFKWVLIDMLPATNNSHLKFNFSTDGGSSYLTNSGTTGMTTTSFVAWNDEGSPNTSGLSYQTSYDLPHAGTGGSSDDMFFMPSMGNGADESGVGELYLFNPASTTYVKHFHGTAQEYQNEDRSQQHFVGGYCNTTSAINACIFRFYNSVTFSGTIKQYGLIAT